MHRSCIFFFIPVLCFESSTWCIEPWYIAILCCYMFFYKRPCVGWVEPSWGGPRPCISGSSNCTWRCSLGGWTSGGSLQMASWTKWIQNEYFQFPSVSTLKFEPVFVCFCHLILAWICWRQSYAVPQCAIFRCAIWFPEFPPSSSCSMRCLSITYIIVSPCQGITWPCLHSDSDIQIPRLHCKARSCYGRGQGWREGMGWSQQFCNDFSVFSMRESLEKCEEMSTGWMMWIQVHHQLSDFKKEWWSDTIRTRMALLWACQIVPKPSWRSNQVRDVKDRFDEFDVLQSFHTNSRSLLLRSRAAVTKVTTVNQRVRKKWRGVQFVVRDFKRFNCFQCFGLFHLIVLSREIWVQYDHGHPWTIKQAFCSNRSKISWNCNFWQYVLSFLPCAWLLKSNNEIMNMNNVNCWCLNLKRAEEDRQTNHG